MCLSMLCSAQGGRCMDNKSVAFLVHQNQHYIYTCVYVCGGGGVIGCDYGGMYM